MKVCVCVCVRNICCAKTIQDTYSSCYLDTNIRIVCEQSPYVNLKGKEANSLAYFSTLSDFDFRRNRCLPK
jgi:hypothetical protein